MRFTASAVAVSAALAFAAAGCGGGTSAEEKWAGDVCTNLANWKEQIQKEVSDAQSKLQSPTAGTLEALKTDVNQAVDATQQLASNLKALGPPNTSSGTQAKQQLEALAAQLQNTVTQAKQAIASLPKGAGVSQTVTQLASLGPALQSLVANTKSALNSVKSSSSDIKEGFDQADSCKQFR